MRVILLGTGGYYPTDKRQTACVWLPEAGIALDAGTGLWRLRDMDLPAQIHILLSHGHLDHSGGLVYLLGALRRENRAGDGQAEGVTVWAPGTIGDEVVERIFGEAVFGREWDEMPFQTATRRLPTEPFELGGMKIETLALAHGRRGSVAFRLTDRDGKTLVYLTDTFCGAEHVDFCRDADLILGEAFVRSEAEEVARAAGHSTPRHLARLAADARARQLVLIHINPDDPSPETLTDEATSTFPNTILSHDGMEFRL